MADSDEGETKTEKHETNNALIKVDIQGKAAEKLVDKIARGIRGVAAPWQIKRVARAEAEATLIKANSEIQIAELQRRAMHRLVEEEARHQHNMEAITAKSIPLLMDGADPDAVDDDWISNFFDGCRSVSNEEMQSLWARVLAGEVNTPGSFSRRTVNYLRDLDRRECEFFTLLCRFACDVRGHIPMIFDERDPIYRDNHLRYVGLTHLESIGLIKLGSFNRSNMPSVVEVKYFDETFTLHLGDRNHFGVGRVLFTLAGHELSQIAGATPIPGFADYLRGKWQKYVEPPRASPFDRAPTVREPKGEPRDVPTINAVVSSLSEEIGHLARSQHSIDNDVNALTRKVEDLDPSNH